MTFLVSSKVSLKELQETESTVLYYIYQSALDNAKGSMDYVRCLKSVINAPEYILDNFVMSVLLLLSGLYENQALQILKSALLRQVQEEENRNNSGWLRKVLPDNICAMDTINQVIENRYFCAMSHRGSKRNNNIKLRKFLNFNFMFYF